MKKYTVPIFIIKTISAIRYPKNKMEESERNWFNHLEPHREIDQNNNDELVWKKSINIPSAPAKRWKPVVTEMSLLFL